MEVVSKLLQLKITEMVTNDTKNVPRMTKSKNLILKEAMTRGSCVFFVLDFMET